MATISSAGIGSGLNVESMVTQLMAVERQPLTQMQTEASNIDTKISAYGKIQSYMSTLRDAASAMTKPATWGDSTAASGDASVVSATGGTSAVAGSYAVSVQQLASAQSLASSAYASSASVVGEGDLKIELGTWSADQSSFTPQAGHSTVSVSIGAGDTLAQVRDKINSAGAGVTASIVTDASGARLVMRSGATGEANAFRVIVTDTDGNSADNNGLSRLGYDPSAGVSPMSRTLKAADAKATVDGLAVTSPTNTLADVVQGVTLKLGKVSADPVEVTVSSNTDSIQKAVTDFANAYNDLAKYLTTQTSYNATSKSAGSLQGDASVNALRSALRGLGSGNSTASSVVQRLADIGLDPQADGTLKVDKSKLADALGSKLGEVKKLFATSSGATDAENGLGYRLRKWGDSLLGTDGSITTRTESLQRRKGSNTDRQDAFEQRMAQVEKRMRAQYTALDTQMAKMNSLQSYVSQQLAAMSSSSSG
jgi:flagellar hook-associated protein 2